MFVFDFDTYIDQEFGEAYAAGSYDMIRLRDSWDRDLTCKEIQIKRKNIIVFDRSDRNPVMNMLKNLSDNYEGDERT